MKPYLRRVVTGSTMLAALLAPWAANAQLGDLLKQGGTTGPGNSMGNLEGLGGALAGKSMTSGSMGNVAGLLEFCIKNNFLGGGASSVKDSLMSKLGVGVKKPDSGYREGGMGLLKSGDGQQIDLSGGGLKEKITKQVCDTVLSQAKSFL